jgi:5-methyltetrahydrofolate--homocysteine methyltransferase
MGTYLDYEWDWSTCETPAQIVEMARGWAQEGIQIIGGCCGAQPAHNRALAEAFAAPAVV